MKNLCIFLFLFISLQSFAQENKNSFKLGFLVGGTSHLGATGYGYHAQYDYAVSDRLSASIGFGQLHGNSTSNGTSKGNAGGVTWDNSYIIKSSEGYNYAEINTLYSYAKRWDFMDLKIGGGVTFLSNWLDYDKNVKILQGVIVGGEAIRHRENVSMVNFVLDNDFKLNDRLLINCKITFRKTIKEQEPLERVVNYGGFGQSTSTSEMDYLGAMVVGLGYRF